MEVVYTIGNFIPIPVPKDIRSYGFGERRNSLAKDYWDLTLYAVYHHYTSQSNCKLDWNKWDELFRDESNKDWLDQFETWEGFVEQNFMQPFLEKEDDPSSPPKELWEGHFAAGNVLPEGEQFEKFFRNAAERIQKRGARIAEKYIENTQ